jgi:Na+-translocating ferredoxin:NAD+ oxidoreductase RNF subunit RnfB
MGVWGYILLFSVGIALFILLLALFFGLITAFFARRFSEKSINKNLSELEKLLPGKNCGECGCVSCAEYARAVFSMSKGTDCCTRGSSQLPQQLDDRMEQFLKMMENDAPNDKDVLN